jgi:hypothetical protein
MRRDWKHPHAAAAGSIRGRKMLGAVAGGSVRLFPTGDDGHLGIAEGIETAIAATMIFGIPTCAALSADGLRRWEWPQAVMSEYRSLIPPP